MNRAKLDLIRTVRNTIASVILSLVSTGFWALPSVAQDLAPTEKRSFLSWCQERDRLSEAQRSTVRGLRKTKIPVKIGRRATRLRRECGAECRTPLLKFSALRKAPE